MSEQKQVALKLRFVLMDRCLIRKHENWNLTFLGFDKNNPYPFGEKSVTEIESSFFTSIPYSEPNSEMFVTNEKRDEAFKDWKVLLNSFAANNAFHGQSEPPVPRIEPQENGYHLYLKTCHNPVFLTWDEMTDLSLLFDYPRMTNYPIYEPTAQMFESKWRKESPLEIDKDEIRARVCKDDNYDSENIYFLSTAVKNVIDYTIDQCNKLNAQAGIESWVFTMWKVK